MLLNQPLINWMLAAKNVDNLLSQFEPAISGTEGERDSKNKTYMANVVKANVSQTVEDIRSRSKIVKQLEDSGKISVVGAYYSLQDGSVKLVN